MAGKRVELELSVTGLAQVQAGLNAAASQVSAAAAKVNAVGDQVAQKALAASGAIESAADWYARTAVAGARVLTIEEQRVAATAQTAASSQDIAESAAAAARYKEAALAAEKRHAQEEAQRLANLGRALNTEKQVTAEKKAQASAAQQAAAATEATAAGGAGGAGGRAGGRRGRFGLLGQTAVYTASDLVSSSAYGINARTLAIQQGPQVVQALLMSGSVVAAVVGAVVAAVGAAFLVGKFAVNRLEKPMKDAESNLAGSTGLRAQNLMEQIQADTAAGSLRGPEGEALYQRVSSLLAAQKVQEGREVGSEGRMDELNYISNQLLQAQRERQRLLVTSYEQEAADLIAAEEQKLEKVRAYGEEAVELRRFELDNILSDTRTSLDSRLAANDRYYDALKKANDDELAAMQDWLDQRKLILEANIEAEKGNVEKVAQLRAQLKALDEQRNLIGAGAGRRSNQIEAGREQGERGIRAENIKQDWEKTDAEKWREADALGLASGPNPDSFKEQGRANIVEQLNEFGTVAEQTGRMVGDTIGAAVDGIADSITGLIQGTMDWSDALTNIGRSVFNQIINSMAQMFAQWIIKMTLIRALESMFSASRKAETSTELGLNTANAAAASGGSFGTSAILGLVAFLALMGAAFALSGAFAKGGRPPTGRPALVGELGPELFIPDTAGTIVPADRTRQMIEQQAARNVIPSSGGGADPRYEQLAAGGGSQGRNGTLNVLMVDDARSAAAKDFLQTADGEAMVMRIVRGNAVQLGIPT